jgi:hypothetical protein
MCVTNFVHAVLLCSPQRYICRSPVPILEPSPPAHIRLCLGAGWRHSDNSNNACVLRTCARRRDGGPRLWCRHLCGRRRRRRRRPRAETSAPPLLPPPPPPSPPSPPPPPPPPSLLPPPPFFTITSATVPVPLRYTFACTQRQKDLQAHLAVTHKEQGASCSVHHCQRLYQQQHEQHG